MASPTTDRPAAARSRVERVLIGPLVFLALLAATASGSRSFDPVDPALNESRTSKGTSLVGGWLFDQPPALDVPAPVVAITVPAIAVPAAATAAPTATATATPASAPAAAKKWLPSGKGMWVYVPDQTEKGNVDAIVARAKAAGLTHLWVRMGSAWDGFNAAPFITRLLPVAHAAGLKIIGWDFPKLEPIDADIERALTMINHTTPGGHRIDAFSADIETRAEGTRISAESARTYGAALRAGVGADYPLIATVPRPSKERASFPFAEVVADYDAIAPMVYWLDRQPDTDVAGALRDLAKFGKPVYPVGQAYDGSKEGGRKGVPPPDELNRFMATAEQHGAAGVSFWSWQAADQPAWDAIRDAPQFAVKATAVAAPSVPHSVPSP